MMDLLGYIIVLFLFVVIIISAWWIYLYIKENITPRNQWLTTEGTIYISDVIEYLDVGDSDYGKKYETKYRVDIQCVFLVDGVSYRVSPKFIHKGLLEKYPVGKVIQVDYDPKNPNRAEFAKKKPGYEHL